MTFLVKLRSLFERWFSKRGGQIDSTSLIRALRDWRRDYYVESWDKDERKVD